MKSTLLVSLALVVLVIGAAVVLAARKSTGTKSNQTMKDKPADVTVRLLNADGTPPIPSTFLVGQTEEEWRARLTSEQYAWLERRAQNDPLWCFPRQS
jgi:hypothetical protein